MTRSRCEDCGAPATDVTCSELFERLLALDHSRRQPWGELHGQSVACYFLQHPNARRAPRDRTALYEFLEGFVADGGWSGNRAPLTIHDVALDGTFPAAGHRERIQRWATSVLASHHDER
jgi:hypothetical protein